MKKRTRLFAIILIISLLFNLVSFLHIQERKKILFERILENLENTSLILKNIPSGSRDYEMIRSYDLTNLTLQCTQMDQEMEELCNLMAPLHRYSEPLQFSMLCNEVSTCAGNRDFSIIQAYEKILNEFIEKIALSGEGEQQEADSSLSIRSWIAECERVNAKLSEADENKVSDWTANMIAFMTYTDKDLEIGEYFSDESFQTFLEGKAYSYFTQKKEIQLRSIELLERDVMSEKVKVHCLADGQEETIELHFITDEEGMCLQVDIRDSETGDYI
ncbi:hypothetical protein ABXS75_12105 [Roseburia hominis]